MDCQVRYGEPSLPNLPPELIQPIIRHVFLTAELCDSIKLRRVNSTECDLSRYRYY